MCKSIEERITSAARRRENNLQNIQMKIKLEKVRREKATVFKIKEVVDSLAAEEVSDPGKRSTTQQKTTTTKRAADNDDDEAYGNAAKSSRDHLLRHSVNVSRPLSAL